MAGWIFSAVVMGVIFVVYSIIASQQTKQIEREILGILERGVQAPMAHQAGPDITPMQGPPEGHIVAQQINFNEAVSVVKRTVVSIRGYAGVQPQGGADGAGTPGHAWRGHGTGFVISPAGYIITTAETVKAVSRFQVTRFDQGHTHVYEATVVEVFPSHGLAVLRTNNKTAMPTAMLGDSSRVRMGDWILAVGSPMGMKPITVAGIVSSVGRNAAINPSMRTGEGFFGGPLVNGSGEVVGVLVRDGASVPANHLRGLLNRVPIPFLPNLTIRGTNGAAG